MLTVKSKKLEDNSEDEHIYRGISTRSFERSWTLNDEVKVKGIAKFENGLLEISMVREIPEDKNQKLFRLTKQNLGGEQSPLNLTQ